MECGKYGIIYDLGIHKRPGLSCDRIRKCYKAGEVVDIEKIKYLKYSVWGQTEAGWILMYMNKTVYVFRAKN